MKNLEIHSTYSQGKISYYVKEFKRQHLLTRTNNVGTRDEHMRIIIEQLIEMINFLSIHIECMASEMHNHKDVRMW